MNKNIEDPIGKCQPQRWESCIYDPPPLLQAIPQSDLKPYFYQYLTLSNDDGSNVSSATKITMPEYFIKRSNVSHGQALIDTLKIEIQTLRHPITQSSSFHSTTWSNHLDKISMASMFDHTPTSSKMSKTLSPEIRII
ncbi:hypothetical protein V6N13_118536 [Hibiscus sabdariffa]|uniref:Uncharacterized protein n=2 Tax=Hibiscus sabdariffa TaxID=183260 RepID=A0ABR2BSR0_9ROSI